MGGDVAVDQSTAAMLDHHKHIQQPKGRRYGDEEIAGNDSLSVQAKVDQRKSPLGRPRGRRGRYLLTVRGDTRIPIFTSNSLAYKVGKHFALTIQDSGFEFHRLQKQIAAEAALDGLYVIRTSVPKKKMSSAEAVRSYKALAEVERAFRSMKTIDLHIRPIHYHLEARARAHLPVHARLLC